jgi:putative peptidoglycan lipid II flippase
MLAMLANIGLSLGFMSLFDAAGWMPHGGLALANSLATTGEMVVLVYLIGRRLGGMEGQRLLSAVWRMGAACLAMLLGLVVLGGILAAAPAWALCISSIMVGGGIYGLVTLLLGSEEPRALMRTLRRRINL